MPDNLLPLNDIHYEIIDTVDKYIKIVLINAKNRYFRTSQRTQKNRLFLLKLSLAECTQAYANSLFSIIDSEYYQLGDDVIQLDKSDLTDAMQSLTPIQLAVFLQSALKSKSQEELAAEYGVSKRMIQKHKRNAIIKLRKRLARWDPKVKSAYSQARK